MTPYDILAILGLALLVAGVWVVFTPGAAAMVGGGFLMVLGAGGSMAESRRRRGEHGG